MRLSVLSACYDAKWKLKEYFNIRNVRLTPMPKILRNSEGKDLAVVISTLIHQSHDV